MPPPPPPGGYSPPPQQPSALGGQSNVDIGAAFQWALATFSKYAAAFVTLAAVVWAIHAVGILFTAWLTDRLIGTCNPTVVIGQNGIVTASTCTASIGTTILAGLITALVFGVLAGIATIGVYRAALKTTLGQVPGFQDLTSGEHLGKTIWVLVVFWLASAVGFVLCILPMFVVIFLFQFAPLFALDKGYGVGPGFRGSFEIATKNFLPVLISMIVWGVANWIGNGLGSGWLGVATSLLSLFTLPFAALFAANIYRQLNREAIAA